MAFKARERPLRAVVISASICAGMTVVSVLGIVAVGKTSVLVESSGFVILRGIAIGLFAAPLAIALRRQTRIQQARERLLANRTSAPAASVPAPPND